MRARRFFVFNIYRLETGVEFEADCTLYDEVDNATSEVVTVPHGGGGGGLDKNATEEEGEEEEEGYLGVVRIDPEQNATVYLGEEHLFHAASTVDI